MSERSLEEYGGQDADNRQPVSFARSANEEVRLDKGGPASVVFCSAFLLGQHTLYGCESDVCNIPDAEDCINTASCMNVWQGDAEFDLECEDCYCWIGTCTKRAQDYPSGCWVCDVDEVQYCEETMDCPETSSRFESRGAEAALVAETCKVIAEGEN